MWIVIIIFILVAAVISTAVYVNYKSDEKYKYYTAAKNILKDDYLQYSLLNPMKTGSDIQQPNGQKIMVYIKSIKTKPKKRYVFDPEKVITIGRFRSDNAIYLNEAIVSQRHCCIFLYDNTIYLQDLNSSNGTLLRRGRLRQYTLQGGQQMAIADNDVIEIGSTKLKIKLFYYDMIYM